MFRQDSAFRWKPAYKFIDAGRRWGVVAGTPSESVVNSLGMPSYDMSTAGDIVGLYVDASEVPYIDHEFPIDMRVRWSTGSATAADTITWIILYGTELSESGAASAAGTALDTTIAQDTVGTTTAYTILSTAWGSIAPKTAALLSRGFLISVENDAMAAGLTEAVHFLGVEIKYTPKYLAGYDGMTSQAKDADVPWLFWR
jgi:hypothetical protein